MNVRIARIEDMEALAAFARLAYSQAFRAELGASKLDLHLTGNMANEPFERLHLVDTFYLIHRGSVSFHHDEAGFHARLALPLHL